MKTLNETQFKKNLTTILDKVGKNHLPITITRENKESLVILSLQGYHAIERLIDIMQDPDSYAQLLKEI